MGDLFSCDLRDFAYLFAVLSGFNCLDCLVMLCIRVIWLLPGGSSALVGLFVFVNSVAIKSFALVVEVLMVVDYIVSCLDAIVVEISCYCLYCVWFVFIWDCWFIVLECLVVIVWCLFGFGIAV